MPNGWPWLALLVSALIVGAYELLGVRAGRRDPTATARTAHSVLRGEWVRALSKQPGSEILAVQALRNSLMSATINASTSVIALMGAINLLLSDHGSDSHVQRPLSTRVVLEVGIVLALFAVFVCSAMAMRYYHHVGFAMSLPVASPERAARESLAVRYLQRGGVLYSWSLRCFLYVAPLAVGLIVPLSMPIAAVALTLVLRLFDGAARSADDS